MYKQFMIKTITGDATGTRPDYLFFDTREEAENMYNKILQQYRRGICPHEPGFYRAISKEGLYMKER